MIKFIGRVLLIACFYLFILALSYLGYVTYRNNLTGWFFILTAFAYGFGGPYLLYSEQKKENRENIKCRLWRPV
jgi:pilus assembly protein TadC